MSGHIVAETSGVPNVYPHTCDPLKLALRVAAASDTLARWHRDIMSSNSGSSPEVESWTPSEVDSTYQPSPRELQILQLTERVAIAAESIAQSQRQGAQTAIVPHLPDSKTSAPSAMKVASVVAKEARRSYDRQMACSAVPHAWEIEVVGPEWVQQQLNKQLMPTRSRIGDQVQSLSNTYSLCLTCPLSGNLLSVPVRGTWCEHIECFDLESFRRSAPIDWRCPMFGCPEYITPDTIMRDSFFEALLRQIEPSQNSILLSADLIGFNLLGSMAQRAQALAIQACAFNSPTSHLRFAKAKPMLAANAAPIEIVDSDSEGPPPPKRGKKQRSRL